MSGFWKVCSFLCTQYLDGLHFAWIAASMRRGMEAISLWHCSGVMEAQVALIAAFRSSALLSLMSLIFLLTILHRFSMGFRSGRVCWPIKHGNTKVIEPAFGTFGSVGRCQVLLEKGISISIKLVSRKKHEVLWHFLVWLRWLWTSENTVDQHQQMTWLPKSSLTAETSHWTSSSMDSVPLHSSSRLWDLDFQMKCKIYFHLKRGLWTTDQQSSSFSP